ncbi:hypothetical protein Ahy_A05g022722 [Arachis hypogaea]|uniref:RNase H type-1 domain-containing protein n=1 Tax=Arachis hypogaea TaxID=3818 RepID=A0A445D1B2_ARAHY|nr:hypothetical protein Ahy_A05g022722 [Arachis hypogaea]
MDGSFFNQTGNTSCGGVVRNHLGRGCSIMQSELWGIIKGLEIATANEFYPVIIESDSDMAINFVKHGCPAQHSCATLLEDIAILVKKNFQVRWNHILRKANSPRNDKIFFMGSIFFMLPLHILFMHYFLTSWVPSVCVFLAAVGVYDPLFL